MTNNLKKNQINSSLISFGDGIFAVDSGYIRKQFASIHLVVEEKKVAIIDTGTNYSVNNVLEALKTLKLSNLSVKWIFLTHIHLDHAGGAGKLVNLFPNAKVAVHSRGVRHMIEPKKLWDAVVNVYGLKTAIDNYGTLVPISKNRIVPVGEGDILFLGTRAFEFWNAPGHANHHVFIRDTKTKSIFTGDTFGVSYRELDTSKGSFAFISSTPSQFDPDAALNSIRRIMESDASMNFLTHYSQLTDIQHTGNCLLKLVNDYVRIAELNSNKENVEKNIEKALTELLCQNAQLHGVSLSRKDLINVLQFDIKLNASGLVTWLNRK